MTITAPEDLLDAVATSERARGAGKRPPSRRVIVSIVVVAVVGAFLLGWLISLPPEPPNPSSAAVMATVSPDGDTAAFATVPSVPAAPAPATRDLAAPPRPATRDLIALPRSAPTATTAADAAVNHGLPLRQTHSPAEQPRHQSSLTATPQPRGTELPRAPQRKPTLVRKERSASPPPGPAPRHPAPAPPRTRDQPAPRPATKGRPISPQLVKDPFAS